MALENYPIRDLMSECAEEWNSRDTAPTPFVAAATFLSELRRRHLRYDTYLQTIITGGGHTHDLELARNDAIARNVANGLQVGEMLHQEGVVDLNSSAEAAAMPPINGWQADDWMTFWPLIIAKPDLPGMNRSRFQYLERSFAEIIWERVNFHGLDMDSYRDRTIPKSERLSHYASHANALHEMLSRNKVPLHPVWRIIGLLGIEESVGSTTEKYYATNIGVRAFQAVLARVEPLQPEELSNEALGKDISHLRQLGVKALAGTPSQQFILVEDRTATNWKITDPS